MKYVITEEGKNILLTSKIYNRVGVESKIIKFLSSEMAYTRESIENMVLSDMRLRATKSDVIFALQSLIEKKYIKEMAD